MGVGGKPSTPRFSDASAESLPADGPVTDELPIPVERSFLTTVVGDLPSTDGARTIWTGSGVVSVVFPWLRLSE